jgi:hypothetical protein
MIQTIGSKREQQNRVQKITDQFSGINLGSITDEVIFEYFYLKNSKLIFE